MNVFIQTITELFLDREEFLRIYSPINKTMKFMEFFCIVLGAISLSVSAVLVNPPYTSGYIVLITILVISNYFFLSLVSSLVSYTIDFKAKNLIKSGDFPSLVASSRCLNIIYLLSCPIAFTLSFLGMNGFSAFFSAIVISISFYVWIFSGIANSIYAMGSFRTFKSVAASIFFILYTPFLILFYFLMNLSVVI